jgi:formimidoylglutamate deiminase
VDDLLADVVALDGLAGDDADTTVGLALHSLRAVPPEAMEEALAGLDGALPGAPVHIHVAEQRREVEACLAWSGTRPVRWLLDHAPVDRRWCLVHATHVRPGELQALATRGAVVGLCPTTEANLGDGIFPFPTLRDAGGRWGIGTDSHVSTSPAAELRTLEYGQRLVREERNVAPGAVDASTGRTLLEGAWGGGARACGRALGKLEPGHRADVVVLDPEHPALVGRCGDEILDAWLFSGEATPVRHVMVGGEWMVLDGRHRHQEEILERYRETARRLTG